MVLTKGCHIRTVILLIGWSIVAFFLYKISNTENNTKLYDPFEILGISTVGSLPSVLRLASLKYVG